MEKFMNITVEDLKQHREEAIEQRNKALSLQHKAQGMANEAFQAVSDAVDLIDELDKQIELLNIGKNEETLSTNPPYGYFRM